MKIVILITVIESLAVTLAIMYFYCRRSQILQKTKWHYIVVPRANGEGKNSKSKK